MEVVYLILIFLGPGLLIKAMREYFSLSFPKNEPGRTTFEQLFMVVIDSLVISIIAIFLVSLMNKKVSGFYILNFGSLFKTLNHFSYMSVYIVICVLLSIAWIKLHDNLLARKINEYQQRKIKDKYNNALNPSSNVTVWTDIFLEKRGVDAEGNARIVKVYRDEKYLMSGFIGAFDEKSQHCGDLELLRTDEIENVIKMDAEKPEHERWLPPYSEFEYFNPDNGIRIKFYESGKVIEHWEEI